jgi:uncharacterized RDD family membrane protein YckC
MTENAGLVSRFVAYVLDALAVALSVGAGAVVAGLVASVTGAAARELVRVLISGCLVFLPAVLALYCAFFWTLAGRTPGMAVLGLRVVRTDGRRVRWFAALVRALLLAYFPIGALWLVVNRRHYALHDKIARTAVVRTPAPT